MRVSVVYSAAVLVSVKAVLPEGALRVVGHVVETTVHAMQSVGARATTRGGRSGGLALG
jgi:hypothetical protein